MSRSACNDCGKAFDGEDAKAAAAHADDAHPGMGRLRWRTAEGKSFLACPDCDHVVVEGSLRHLTRPKADTASGKSFDPVDLFDAHRQSHGGEV